MFQELRNNQSGIGLTAVILTVLVVGVVGFAGWYVMNSDNKDQEKQDDTKSQRQDDDELPAGFLEYKNKDLGVQFAYPANWGEVSVEMQPGEVGTAAYITFANQKDDVSASLTTANFELGAGKGLPFYDSGYIEQNGKFYNSWQYARDKQKIEASGGSVNKITSNGREYLEIEYRYDEEGFYEAGNYYEVSINISGNDKFPGIGFATISPNKTALYSILAQIAGTVRAY